MTGPDSAPISTAVVDVVEAQESPSDTINSGTREQEVQTDNPEMKTVEDFFDKGDIESLVNMENSSEAQLAAAVLISDSYNYVNPTHDKTTGLIKNLNLDLISQRLNLDSIETVKMEENKKELIELSTKKSTERENKKNIAQLEKEQHLRYKKLTLPIRKAILEASNQFPQEYSYKIIEGLKTYSEFEILKEERSLLKEQYATNNESIKRKIAETVHHNIQDDLESFHILPFEELTSSHKMKEKSFVFLMGNPNCDELFVNKYISPNFFPNEEHDKVVDSWKVLREVTPPYKNSKYSFFSEDNTRSISRMNTEIFQEFMDNSKELIPTISILKDYGFVYSPNDHIGQRKPEYINKLKNLGESKENLKMELENIKRLVPEYKYSLETDYVDSYAHEENPFCQAINQSTERARNSRTPSGLQKTINIFNSIDKFVPDRWRSGFLGNYIYKMIPYAHAYYAKDLAGKWKELALEEVSKYVLDSRIEEQDVERFGWDYLEIALEPRSEDIHIQTAFEFCSKHSEKIVPEYREEGVSNEDATWRNFSFTTSDLYRYPAIHGREEEGIRRGKRDLIYSAKAAIKIKDPKIREETIANLIYGLTDPDIGDFTFAENFITLIETPVLKEEAQRELELERRRIEKDETTAWKKMEKIKILARENEIFIKNLFGYGTEEGYKSANQQYGEVATQTFPPDYGRYSEEKTNLLEHETERIKDSFQVSINITWDNLLAVLDNERVISHWENEQVRKERDEDSPVYLSSGRNYSERRDRVERYLANRAKGGRNDPHPIYGAAFANNGRDEIYGGAGGGYGETFIVLKKDRIKDRTSFCYDDSFNGYSHWLLDWDGGISAKAIHNLSSNQSRHGYVEAQILGGVSIEDIDSVNIPSSAFSKENSHGFSAGRNVTSEIERLKEEYPNIKFNIIQDNK